MADEIDLANDLIDNEVSMALKKIRQQNAVPTEIVTKACIECGEEIPSARQKLGFSYCVPCAQEKERREALFAGG
jgi:RNA polymerase-binding transcription factor DksA